jgi:hypothetical protein
VSVQAKSTPRQPRLKTFSIDVGRERPLLVRAFNQPQAMRYLVKNEITVREATEDEIWDAGARGERPIDATKDDDGDDGEQQQSQKLPGEPGTVGGTLLAGAAAAARDLGSLA